MESITNSLFSKKELYLLECQNRGFGRTALRHTSARYRMQTFNNMHLAECMEFTDKFHIPKLLPYTGHVDFEIYPYARRKGLSGKNQALHNFTYDWRFDNALWRHLEETTYKLRRFDILFTPDYSLYVEPQFAHQNIEFIYRTRFIGAYWQRCGFGVMPTVSWGNADSFEYAFEGLPIGSVLAVCGTGHDTCRASRVLWEYGLRRMEQELAPTTIIIYGREVEVSGLHTPLMFIPDHITKRFRQ